MDVTMRPRERTFFKVSDVLFVVFVRVDNIVIVVVDSSYGVCWLVGGGENEN